MDIANLISESHNIALAKGWWDGPRSFAGLFLLMQSEISEALEDYRAGHGWHEVWYEHKISWESRTVIECTTSPLLRGQAGKPCGISIELADVVIRVADFAGRYQMDLCSLPKVVPCADFETALARASWHISLAYELSSEIEVPLATTQKAIWTLMTERMGKVIQQIVLLCEAQGIDLDHAIQIKQDYNRTRPYRHGNKVL